MNKKIRNSICLGASIFFTGSGCANSQVSEQEDLSNELSMDLAEAPNIVYIVLDDMGFSDLGSYGSEINTPNIDKLAQNGLRYNNFHVTPMSSPTRAALLTGRNTHSIGMSRLANYSLDVPHSMAEVTEAAAFIPKVLTKVGYSTFAVGKWHLAPVWEATASGPFDHWPIGKGFENFYGFMDGETDQYFPELVQDNSYLAIEYPKEYHVTEDLTDKAISYIQSRKAVTPDKPFMLYYATGAPHSPHQVPKRYSDRYDGVYAVGWDVIRQQRFEKQKELGIIPQNAKLAPLNEGVKPWDDLDSEVQRLFIEYQKTYAGFLEHTDEQIGRLIDTLEQMGELDNTLIFFISDNGPSPSGKETGTLNTINIKNGIKSDLTKDIAYIDTFSDTVPNYPRGWSQVSATPFSYYKESAHYLGGIRVPLIIHYPKGIQQNQQGQIRSQFSFVTDITKTVYDLLGINMPKFVDGVEQIPLQGYSLQNTFNDSTYDTGRTTQYFELYGNRALYHDNYFLSSRHQKGEDFNQDIWALYDLNNDYSQLIDISKDNKKQLNIMLDIWNKEAKKYGLDPLDDREHVQLIAAQISKDIGKYGKEMTLYSNTSLINANRSTYPTTLNRSHTITARINRKSIDEEGVLLAFGNNFGGYTFYIMNNRLNYEYNYDRAATSVQSDIPIPIGNIEVSIEYKKKDRLGGIATLLINGKNAGSIEIPKVYPFVANSTDPMSVGRDTQRAVSPAYSNKGHFAYSGDLEKVTIVSKDDYNKLNNKVRENK